MVENLKTVEAKMEQLKKSISEQSEHVQKLINARKNMLSEIKRLEAVICQEDGAWRAYEQVLKLFKPKEPEIIDVIQEG